MAKASRGSVPTYQVQFFSCLKHAYKCREDAWLRAGVPTESLSDERHAVIVSVKRHIMNSNEIGGTSDSDEIFERVSLNRKL